MASKTHCSGIPGSSRGRVERPVFPRIALRRGKGSESRSDSHGAKWRSGNAGTSRAMTCRASDEPTAILAIRLLTFFIRLLPEPPLRSPECPLIGDGRPMAGLWGLVTKGKDVTVLELAERSEAAPWKARFPNWGASLKISHKFAKGCRVQRARLFLPPGGGSSGKFPRH
jgi:hypothetical protein